MNPHFNRLVGHVTEVLQTTRVSPAVHVVLQVGIARGNDATNQAHVGCSKANAATTWEEKASLALSQLPIAIPDSLPTSDPILQNYHTPSQFTQPNLTPTGA